ncbi:MAG: NADP-specific glutamate dehydrogenase [Epsilonproteobacteria bacterium]|nr:NADP-specific glutamate dehydrogenase [Campylobacterota bacterium]
MKEYVNSILEHIKQIEPYNEKFLESVTDVLTSIIPYLEANPHLKDVSLLERIIEPERVLTFRVPWVDDNGIVRVNRGYRVEFNSAIGPYKGGIRFHKDVSIDTFKFLGFEQTFKNALTSLNIGGGKGGSDFDPHGKSDMEIMRFCQSFMSELFRHIGAHTDIPAGDIGVGEKAIGYLFGMYKKLTNRFDGALSGKPIEFGGSFCRVEATGYGAVYFAEKMLNSHNDTLKDKTVAVSGAGNVAFHVIKKLYEFQAIPVTCSDSTGYIYDKEGINLQILDKLKMKNHKSLAEYTKDRPKAKFIPREKFYKTRNNIWDVPTDIVMPSATENEINLNDAKNIVKNGTKYVIECSNMPSTTDAINYFLSNKIKFAPSKAVNAGGVVTSVYEMSQNASFESLSKEILDEKLKEEMKKIYVDIALTAKEYGYADNLVIGANIRGFKRVATAMIKQGVV